jgi:hypothetical protein
MDILGEEQSTRNGQILQRIQGNAIQGLAERSNTNGKDTQL